MPFGEATMDAERPSLVIAGFLGRGNAGDEAMFQVIHETFSPHFELTACVDHHGAYPDFADWYPYREMKVRHHTHIDTIERMRNCSGLIVGGGSLSLGFGAEHVLMAKARGVPTVLAGCDLWTPHPDPASLQYRALKLWLSLFDCLVLRTERSVLDAKSLGLDPVHAGDWALRLLADAVPDIEPDPSRAVVVLREDEVSRLGSGFRDWVMGVLSDIEANGYTPVLLPFSPEDERFAHILDLSSHVPMIRSWWNARRLKQWIGASGLTVTIGRLHPMIFAAPTATRIAVLRMPHWIGPEAGSMNKLNDMARELGITVFNTAPEMEAALRNGQVGPADPDRVAAALARVDAGLDAMLALFQDRQTAPVVAHRATTAAEPDQEPVAAG